MGVLLRLCIGDTDVGNAYLNAGLKEALFMKLPNGYRGPKNHHMFWRLKKAIYGTRQAARSWNTLLASVIKEYGLQQSLTDPCLFYMLDDNNDIVLLTALFVDDQLVAYRDEKVWDDFIAFLEARFTLKYNKKSEWCLGCKLEYDSEGILIHNERMVLDTIEKFGMEDAKPVSTPADPSVTLSKEQCPMPGSAEEREMESVPYRQLLGTLSYIAFSTRPDITWIVNVLSRYAHNPGRAHWQAAKRVLRYLKGTSDYGIKFKYDDTAKLEVLRC